MNTLKQSLCRHWAYQACRACLWLILAVSLGHAGFAAAAKPQASAAAQSAPVSLAAETPGEQLAQAVTQWVARQQGVRAEQVQLVPLDPRVRIQSCARALTLDLPFSSPETVRVRCAEPAWQLYVRVQLPPVEGRASQGAPVAAASGEQRRAVLVTVGALARGLSVQPQDVRVQQVQLPAGATGYLDNPADAVHAEVLRDLPAGTPLRRSDLRPSVLVRRGQLVQLSVGDSRGFMVSARVEALQDGRMGEQVKLKNPESGRVLTGVVKGPNLVEGL